MNRDSLCNHVKALAGQLLHQTSTNQEGWFAPPSSKDCRFIHRSIMSMDLQGVLMETGCILEQCPQGLGKDHLVHVHLEHIVEKLRVLEGIMQEMKSRVETCRTEDWFWAWPWQHSQFHGLCDRMRLELAILKERNLRCTEMMRCYSKPLSIQPTSSPLMESQLCDITEELIGFELPPAQQTQHGMLTGSLHIEEGTYQPPPNSPC